MTDDPLRALGLEPGAAPVEIRAAWKILALKHHPDQGGDPEKFAEIREAYKKALRAAEDAPCGACNGRGTQTHIDGFYTLTRPF